jgi:starch-binding outer membrane protein, SusD/RagB family
MLKLKYFTLVGLVAAVLGSGCKKIEIKPEGLVDPADGVKTETDVKDLLNACYLSLSAGGFYGGRLQLVSEWMADMSNTSGLQGFDSDIANLRSSPDAGTAESYREPYIAVQRANTVLANMDKVTGANIAKFEGEARFVRAVGHFELVRLYAQPFGYTPGNTHPGIVVKTSPVLELDKPRNTVGEVYAAILADLQAAQALLPAANGVYPTRWAAKGYLAKVFFQMNRFDSAWKYANDVIVNSGATFNANTTTFTASRCGISGSSENVFALIQDATTGARFGTLRNGGNPKFNMGLPLSDAVYATGSAANDRRKAWYFDNSGVKGLGKYFEERLTLPLVYITEMKLIRAECAGELNTQLPLAITDLNDIINRAYIAPSTLPGTANAAAIISKAREQRKLELVYELGDRLQQIKRIGAKGEPSFNKGGAPWNCNGMILQFPASEVSVNPAFVPNPTGGCL